MSGGEPMTGGDFMGGESMNGGESMGGESMNGGTPMTGGVPSDPIADQMACLGIVECLGMCDEDDFECRETCIDSASLGAQSLYQTVIDCIIDNMINSTCAEDDVECYTMLCSEEKIACAGSIEAFNPIEEPVDPINEYESCYEITACAVMCDPDIASCQQDCFDLGNETAQVLFANLGSCLQGSNCQGNDLACLQMYCPDILIELCLTNTTTPQISCGGMFSCLRACQAGDNECQAACNAIFNPDGIQNFNDLNQCLNINMCQDQECVDLNCSTEQTACFAPRDQNCTQILGCLEGCDTTFCRTECGLTATEEAILDYNALAMCVQTNQCTSINCPQCTTEYNSCVME